VRTRFVIPVVGRRWLFPAGAALVAALATVSACSNQREGERCDLRGENGGNDDCLDGLQCTNIRQTTTSEGLCCPVNRTTATSAACKLPPAPPGSDASIPGLPDAGADVTVNEAGGDSSNEASSSDSGTSDASDGGADAPADAPGEGG
jgi:hypothetical protein